MSHHHPVAQDFESLKSTYTSTHVHSRFALDRLWLLREFVAENAKEECEIVFCATGVKVPMVSYLNESCMSLSDMSSGPHGQTSAPVHDFSSVNMSNEVCYKSCSLHKSFTAPSNVTIVYVLVRIREVQSIQFCVMCLVLKIILSSAVATVGTRSI